MKSSPQKKTYSITEALEKARRLCASQERSHQYIRGKLFDWEVPYSDIEPTISQLISEGFLNEERFAKAFAIGKFRQLKWGKQKIIVGLKKQKVDARLIKTALFEIPDDDYLNTLKNLLEKKAKQLRVKNQFVRNKKIANYLISKGFESHLVWDEVRRLTN